MVFGSEQLLGWPLVRVWGASPWGYGISGDAASVLRSADCFKVASVDNFFAVSGGDCPYIYGNSLILVLNLLGLTELSANLVAWLFILLIATSFAIITALFFNATKAYFPRVAAVATLCSPPVALLLERANFDALIFSLVFVFGVALTINVKGELAAVVALAAAGLFKFYAVVAGLTVVLTNKKVSRKVLLLAPLAVTSAVIATELFVRTPGVPVDVGGSFGAMSLGLWFNFTTNYFGSDLELSKTANALIGLSAVAIGMAVLRTVSLRKKIDNHFLIFLRSSFGPIQALAFSSLTVFLACYLLGTNYDYRLIFLFPWALYVVSQVVEKKMKVLFTLLTVLAAWMSYNSGIFGQVFGDVVIGLWACVGLWSLLLSGLEFVRQSKSNKVC